jgi:hypothetical protein
MTAHDFACHLRNLDDFLLDLRPYSFELWRQLADVRNALLSDESPLRDLDSREDPPREYPPDIMKAVFFTDPDDGDL